MSYSDKLKSPKWQKKMLEIMSRDKFTCQCCGDKETELHVHHKKYESGMKPWESDSDELTTICKHCHSAIHFILGSEFTNNGIDYKFTMKDGLPKISKRESYDGTRISLMLLINNELFVISIYNDRTGDGNIELNILISEDGLNRMLEYLKTNYHA